MAESPKDKKCEKGCGTVHFLDTYRRWVELVQDAELSAELQAVSGDEKAIEDRFYRELEFGTGGLRGVLGAGTNRMNIYTVAKATQGYSNFLRRTVKAPSVAIAYDSRIHSDLFAHTAAAVFAANGIQVHIYSRLMPTPALSFAVRDLRCSGGIVITASHNPAKYNGYKVYGSDGCQITTQSARAIQSEINRVDIFDDVQQMDFHEAEKTGAITCIGEDTVDRYLQAVGTASLLPPGVPRDAAIVYTPLNGTGISCVPRCLREHGFVNITIPEEQSEPDGKFPTCPYPNPEVREALNVGIACAEKNNSDFVLATDPDCDRVGAAVKTENGYTLISGNEMGVLLLDFICIMRKANRTMPEFPIAVKTIVTTPMAAKIAACHGVELIDVLTGFKFIGEQIGLLEKKGEAERYIFGFEESYGYLSGSFVRDKDAVNASLLICEMFSHYKAQGKTLVNVLDELYRTYGYYENRLLSFAFEGSRGFYRMQELMTDLREHLPVEIAGLTVETVTDYQRSAADRKNGISETTFLPRSNVLRFFLSGGSEAAVRPSGTEPKLKVYLTAVGDSRAASIEAAQQLAEYFTTWAERAI